MKNKVFNPAYFNKKIFGTFCVVVFASITPLLLGIVLMIVDLSFFSNGGEITLLEFLAIILVRVTGFIWGWLVNIFVALDIFYDFTSRGIYLFEGTGGPNTGPTLLGGVLSVVSIVSTSVFMYIFSVWYVRRRDKRESV